MDGTTQSSSDVTDFSEVNSTPLDLDDLFDVQKELIPVSAKWRSIGIALRLKPNILDGIKAENGGDPPACLTSTVTEWLNKNYNVKRFGEPTWQALVNAVGDPAGGANMALARDMARRHKAGGPPPPSSTPPPPPSLVPAVVTSLPHPLPQLHSAATTLELSKAVVFAHENHQAITAKFAAFQTKVCDKLVKNGVDTEQVRLFITNQFAPGDCIPPPPTSLTKMFEAITHHRLWDYFHYSPLVRIVQTFGANDPEMEGWVQTYKQDLKAYQLVTTVEEYIEADLDVADTPPAKRARYDPRYYTPMEWKTKFMDHSLQYLADVWELFSSHYLVPDSPPTALLERVRRGCFSVTWLVPTGLIPSLIKRVQLETEFIQQYRIVKVTVGKECIYKEVTEESTSEEELAHQKNTPPTNTPRGAEGGAEPHDRPQQEEIFGGYDCTFIEPPPSAFQMDCPICSLTLRDPYLTDCCGTNFCHTCSERLQAEHKPCPTCRKNKFELFPNKSLGRTIRQLRVLCTDGCDWTGELGQLENHLDKVVHCVALYDYEKQEDDELSLKEGDVITDVEQIDGSGWCEGVSRGERGLFPDNYVRYLRAIHSPSPSSSKLKKRAATLSEESEAFRKCSADFIKEIEDPELLAWELHSSNVISKKQVDEASMAGLSAMQRKTRVLSAVENQIIVNPAKFQNLLKVLRKQTPLKDVVDKLEETYRSHLKVGDRGTGLKEAVVLHDHEKEHDDELGLQMGDVVTDVKQSEESGFCEGVLSGRQGLFPNFCVRFSRDIELQGQAWYHGWISRETAEERLNKVPYHCFLIRENGANLSLSVKHQGKISHFLIEKNSDGYEIIGTDRKFDTLLQLVDFFMTNSVWGDSRHLLSSPCPRPSPDDAQRSSDTVLPHAPDSKSLLLHPHSRLRWRRVADFPVAMSQHNIVRIRSTIYCGGGYTGGSIDTARQVFQYNPKQDTWSQLPICPTLHFGLTQLDGKLVTVGGEDHDRIDIPINDVYVFQESETWENSIIPPLSIARMYLTAFDYKSTLVVSGGVIETDRKYWTYTDAVEVFQPKTYQWYRAEPLPVASSYMSCAIVKDMCYFLGGCESNVTTRRAYYTSLSNLISRALPPDHPGTSSTPQASPSPPTWQVLPECPLYYSTAAELGGCLLAIGGEDDSDSSSSAVHMYSPSTNSWVRISSGDLPVPRWMAAATQLEGGEVIFVGGDIKPVSPTKTVFVVSTEQ